MKKFLVWLEDKEPQSIEVEAESADDARGKVQRMIDDDTLWNEVAPEFSQSSWEITDVEEVR